MVMVVDADGVSAEDVQVWTQGLEEISGHPASFREENSAGEVSGGFVAASYQLLQLGVPMVRGLHHRAKDASDDELTLENTLRGTGDFGASATSVWAAAHVTAQRDGKNPNVDSSGRQKPNQEARDKFAAEYLKDSRRQGRIYFQLVKPGDRDPLLWEFRVLLRPSIDQRGEIEMLTAPPLDYVAPREKVDRLLEDRPDSSAKDIADLLGLSRATAHRRVIEYGWKWDEGNGLWTR